jgi:hypothetical protein
MSNKSDVTQLEDTSTVRRRGGRDTAGEYADAGDDAAASSSKDEGKDSLARFRSSVRRFASRIPQLPNIFRLMGSSVLGVLAFELVIMAYALAMLATNLGTVVFTKTGLSVTWLAGAQDWAMWLRGRGGLIHAFTLLESLYLLAPQAVIVMLIAGRVAIPRWIVYMAAVGLNWLALGFAFLKLVMFVVSLGWCEYFPDCTDEALVPPTDVSSVYIFRMAESGIMICAFLFNSYVIQWVHAHSEAKDSQQSDGRPFARKHATKQAMADIGYTLIMLILQGYALVMILLVMCSTVFEQSGLTISWLGSPGSYGWMRGRYGAQHIMMFLELLYLIGPEFAICSAAAGHKSVAVRVAFEIGAHLFNIISIILALAKLIEFAVLTGACSNWPECTRETTSADNTVSSMLIARIVESCLLFFGFILAELAVTAFNTELGLRHLYYRRGIQAAVDEEQIRTVERANDLATR